MSERLAPLNAAARRFLVHGLHALIEAEMDALVEFARENMKLGGEDTSLITWRELFDYNDQIRGWLKAELSTTAAVALHLIVKLDDARDATEAEMQILGMFAEGEIEALAKFVLR